MQTLGVNAEEEERKDNQSPIAGEYGRKDSMPSENEARNSYCDADPKKPKKKADKDFGRLAIDEGRSRYVSNQFWASLSDDVRTCFIILPHLLG